MCSSNLSDLKLVFYKMTHKRCLPGLAQHTSWYQCKKVRNTIWNPFDGYQLLKTSQPTPTEVFSLSQLTVPWCLCCGCQWPKKLNYIMMYKCYMTRFFFFTWPMTVSENETQRVFWQLCLHTTKRSEGLKVLPAEFIHNHVTRDSDCWHQVSQSWGSDR